MGRGEGERRSLPQVPGRVEGKRGSQGWWRGEGVNLLEVNLLGVNLLGWEIKSNHKCAAEPIVVNTQIPFNRCMYLSYAAEETMHLL